MPTASPPDLPPPVNHVFVDCENVHEFDEKVIGEKAVNFTFLLGINNTRFDVAVVQKLVAHAASVLLIRLELSGKNAVDFALAYYLGRRVLADPTAYFHIVSKDKGFDPLIEHLRSQHVNARRHDDFATLTFSGSKKPVASTLPTNNTLESRVLGHLRKNVKDRPTTKKRLERGLITFAGKTASAADISALIEKLHKNGKIEFGPTGAVTYHL